MVLIDGKIVTNDLVYCVFDQSARWYGVKYKNSDKYYRLSLRRVLILEEPEKLEKDDVRRLRGILGLDIGTGYCFHSYGNVYYHLYLTDRREIDIADYDFHSREIFSYFQKLADAISNEKNMLAQLYNKVSYYDTENSALKYYLQKEYQKQKQSDDMPLIFPFGCNLSQYEAVKNAIYNNVSVIEGPPGTGKTQTILNILANLIIRKQSCQVVSNNNSAVENVEDKLKDYGLDFFAAKLGSNASKAEFIEKQKSIPDLEESLKVNKEALGEKILELSERAQKGYEAERELSCVRDQLDEIMNEYEYFKRRAKREKIDVVRIGRRGDLMGILLDLQNCPKLGFWRRLKYVFIYRTGNFKFYKSNKNTIIASLQSEIYLKKIDELTKNISEFTTKIDNYKRVENDLIKTSFAYFKAYLAQRYQGYERPKYKLDEIRRSFNYFIQDYPVVLSTTYSARSSLNIGAKFDYVIMDEASQIDLVTGALALSSGQNVVIVGDEMQLANVVSEKEKKITEDIFSIYNLDAAYSFSNNSFLSSLKKVIPEAPNCLLREHYRCEPKIINFCNRKFYGSRLVIMKEDSGKTDTIRVIRTNMGNHARGHVNQRQIDVIKELLPKLSSRDIGIIAPYRDQVAEIRKSVPDYVEVDTIHKFQGREKDIIIISTVDNEISDFVDDPHILNVAISRAKKQLIMIATGNKIENTIIKQFMDYVGYCNFEIETSPIYSIFDYLYSQYTESRIKYLTGLSAVSEYDSEKLMYLVIMEIIKTKDNLGIVMHQPLQALIRDWALMTSEEARYTKNSLTHLDFLIYDKITKKPILAIEVDGYKYHKSDTKQHGRDVMKDKILEKYNIPLLRFSTVGSGEKKILNDKLEQILGD